MLYRADIEIDDDPASFGASVLVEAADRKEALALAKQATIDSYYEQAGGWASSEMKIISAACAKATLPKHGIVMVSGHYHR